MIRIDTDTPPPPLTSPRSRRPSGVIYARWHRSKCLQKCPYLQNLFCTNARIPRFDLGLVVQNHVQQGIMDFQFSVVFDKSQFAEFVHEKAHARSGRADHLRQRFLTELSHDRLWPAFLAEICKQKEKPGEALSLELNN